MVVGAGSTNASDSISIDTGVSDASWNDDRRTDHSPSLGAGNGFDSASGIATTNTNTPHNTPAVVMAA
jgi:hypothetical protein